MKLIKVTKFGDSKVKHSWKRYGVDFSETNKILEEIILILNR